MSEFLKHIPTEKLHEIQQEAQKDNLENILNLIGSELARRALLAVNDSTGFYDASVDNYESLENPDEDRWIIRGED